MNWVGKVPVDNDKLMMLVMVGRRTDLHCLSRVVGIGSKSQNESGEDDKSEETSSIVAGWKKGKSGGRDGGEMWGVVVVEDGEMRVRSL